MSIGNRTDELPVYAGVVKSVPVGDTEVVRVNDPVLADRRILVVEDDPTVSEVAAAYLRSAGLLVTQVADGFAALTELERSVPDLIVLDRMLPGIDGVEVCRRIRRTASVPIIMLTARGSEEDRIEGLEVGADDYLTKPFSPRELVLRVQSLLRRSVTAFTPESAVEIGPFWLDPSARVVTKNGKPLMLTGREFDLLAFFLKRPNQAFGRADLLAAVWGWTVGDLSTVTVHVRRLREKIEVDVAEPAFIRTVWGVGYRFDAAGTDVAA